MEFDFTLTYKNETQRTQTDACCHVPTMSEVVPQPGGGIPFYALSTEEADDTSHEAESDPLWDQGTCLTDTLELDSLLLSAHLQEPTLAYLY